MAEEKVGVLGDWRPRAYQQAAWEAWEGGCTRSSLIWHRRSGKDDISLHWACTQAFERPAGYIHLLPQANQARKAIWDAVNPHTGKRRIDEAFPPRLRRAREQDMQMTFINGSTWQVVGSDNYQAMIGGSTAGVVFSEWALTDPAAWDFIRPILLENNGWAIFITTPRGHNHAERMHKAALLDHNWFAETLTVDDTGVFSPAQIESERRELMTMRGEREAGQIIQQEYFCSFDASIPGAIYGPEVKKAEDDGRVCDLPYDPRFPVTTAWDIGTADATAIVMGQQVGEWIHIIDYIAASGQQPAYFAKRLFERDYAFRAHLFPHDSNQRHWSAQGGTAISVAKQLGISPVRVLPIGPVADRIRTVRATFPKLKFDRTKCAPLLDALRCYQYEWDDARKVFRDQPLHDWASDPADAHGYFCVGFRPEVSPENRPPQADVDYSPFGA